MNEIYLNNSFDLIWLMDDDGYPHYNSLNYLFKEIVSYNLSWDTLLTGKKYKMFTAMESFGFVDQSDFVAKEQSRSWRLRRSHCLQNR